MNKVLQKKIKDQKAKRAKELQDVKDKRALAYYSSTKYVNTLEKEEALNVIVKELDKVAITYEILDRKVPAKYGYTVILDKLLTLAQAIKYLPSVDKAIALKETGLTELSIENLIEAIGNTAYYAKDAHNVVEAVFLDRDRLIEALEAIEVEMNISLVKEEASLSSAKITAMYENAKNKAEEMYINTETMMLEETINYEE
jgi:hypothetical protein